MYSGNLPLIIQMDWNFVVMKMSAFLKSAGFLGLKSFDLDSAEASQSGSNCNPETRSSKLVVLWVYALQGPPAILVIDSNDSYTAGYLENNAKYSDWIGNLAQIVISYLPSMIPANQQAD